MYKNSRSALFLFSLRGSHFNLNAYTPEDRQVPWLYSTPDLGAYMNCQPTSSRISFLEVVESLPALHVHLHPPHSQVRFSQVPLVPQTTSSLPGEVNLTRKRSRTKSLHKSKDREQRAESREEIAESREQRAESREQRAESREQRAESREQRAESRE